MIRSRFGLMGLCAVVFGVMAFGATSAQATVGAHWWILNSAGTVKTDAGSLPAILNVKVDTPRCCTPKLRESRCYTNAQRSKRLTLSS